MCGGAGPQARGHAGAGERGGGGQGDLEQLRAHVVRRANHSVSHHPSLSQLLRDAEVTWAMPAHITVMHRSYSRAAVAVQPEPEKPCLRPGYVVIIMAWKAWKGLKYWWTDPERGVHTLALGRTALQVCWCMHDVNGLS